ncbi:MAG: hypothetical protein KW793_01440 [Candidatus Doudnabacteria bacterium]|nr:hypothetical protein [Candidatus Doudnabacteria bacterium]
MFKKILALLILLLLGIALYAYFSFPKTITKQAVEEEKTIRRITDESVISPVSSFDGDAVWYGLSSGKIMWFDLFEQNSSEYPITQPPTDDFFRIFWPISGNDFIAQGTNSGAPVFSYFNNSQKKFDILPPNVTNLDWLKDGRRIVLVWQSDDKKVQLVTSNADASGYSVIRELPWADMVPKASPKVNTVLMYKNIPSGDVNKIYMFNLDTAEYEEVISEGKNTGVLWSPKGDRFAFSRILGSQPYIFIYDLTTKKIAETGLKSTIDRVAFDSTGSKLLGVNNETDSDSLVSIDLGSLNMETIIKFGNNFTAKNLVPVGQKIFFVGVPDGKLYLAE